MSETDLSALIEHMRAMPGFAHGLGIRFETVARDRVVTRMTAGSQHANGTGRRLHGGVLMALADHTGAMVAIANLPPEHATATIESKTNFFAAGEEGELRAEAVPLHVGRTTIVVQTTVFNPDGRRVSITTQTQIVMPLAGGGRPVRADS